VNLIAGEFSLGLFAGYKDGAAGGVDFNGVAKSLGGRNEEEPSQHFDDVNVSVMIVIKEDDVEEGVVGLIDVFQRFFESFEEVGHPN